MKKKENRNRLNSNHGLLELKGISANDALLQIEQELKDDGLVTHDLGSYTTIKMLPEADLIIQQNLGKNLINQNEYHITTEIHENLIKMLGNLLHAPDNHNVFGSSTTGSSEAIFLSILAAKKKWKKRGYKEKPNIVLCNNAHVSWYKFSSYLDIEVREVAIENINVFPIKKVIEEVDQNSICVVTVLGCTQTGICDPIALLNNELEVLNDQNNWNVGIHVDAAIGGFVVPFLKEKNKQDWDFKLSLVRSINLSGHKFGLVYPGLGWVLFRDQSYFPSELNISSHYLSGSSKSFTLSFSRSSSLVIAQYFNFLHYGIEGYEKIIETSIQNTKQLSILLENTGFFKVLSNNKLPIVIFAFRTKEGFDEKEFTTLIKEKKWMLPYYQLPVNINGTVMRIVVRNDMTISLLKSLVIDMTECYQILKNQYK